MVKKSPSAKTKKENETVEEKIEHLTKEPEMKETPPQVMQVVEVMDEEEEKPKDVEVTPTEAIQDTPEVVEEKTPEEKQQAVVSEFFAKKEQPVPSSPSSFGYPDITVHKKSPVIGVMLWALGVFAIVALIGFVIISVSRGSVKMPTIAVKTTPTPTLAPTITPTPTIDRKSISIQVLNGSGIAGVASKMKALLEEKGYTVAGTGNAKTYDYAKTEIQVTASKSAFLSVLQADLTGSYSIGSAAANLKSASQYDVVVIIGKE